MHYCYLHFTQEECEIMRDEKFSQRSESWDLNPKLCKSWNQILADTFPPELNFIFNVMEVEQPL